jgi:hypothetical protein
MMKHLVYIMQQGIPTCYEHNYSSPEKKPTTEKLKEVVKSKIKKEREVDLGENRVINGGLQNIARPKNNTVSKVTANKTNAKNQALSEQSQGVQTVAKKGKNKSVTKVLNYQTNLKILSLFNILV